MFEETEGKKSYSYKVLKMNVRCRSAWSLLRRPFKQVKFGQIQPPCSNYNSRQRRELCTFSSHSSDQLVDTSKDLLHNLEMQIKTSGPITVAEYMKQVLTNPIYGYYMKRNSIGSSGDFITSPEVSQMFGELIAVWFMNEWVKVGKPVPLQIVELGPGHGTLAADILRVFHNFIHDDKNLSLHLVEISPRLRKIQESRLCSNGTDDKLCIEDFGDGNLSCKQNRSKQGIPISWYYHLQDVPKGFSFFIAHEFFDALPIHKLQRTKDGWKEILIDINNESKEKHLHFILSREATPVSKLFVEPSEQRDHIEVSPESAVRLQELTKRMKEEGGVSLIVDYGHDGSKTDTFRGFREHTLHDPLNEPGSADLTADVDFSFLKRTIADRALSFGPVTQEKFLKDMGISLRLERLLKSSKPELQKDLMSGYDMLANPKKMGERYKFFALFPNVLKDILHKNPPVGFF